MMKRPINSWGTRGVLRHKDNLSKFPLPYHNVQIPLLVRSGIWIVGPFIRSSPPEKIKCHYSPRRSEIGKKAIIQMTIIWEAVHQNERRFLPRIFSDVNAVLISLHELIYEIHLLPGFPDRPCLSELAMHWLLLFLEISDAFQKQVILINDVVCERFCLQPLYVEILYGANGRLTGK
jgi:hypothetical protein